jgi:hypothetical protein
MHAVEAVVPAEWQAIRRHCQAKSGEAREERGKRDRHLELRQVLADAPVDAVTERNV